MRPTRIHSAKELIATVVNFTRGYRQNSRILVLRAPIERILTTASKRNEELDPLR
jgi:hypothetical protein